MHHCLRTDEILREIFQCIESRPTLCALAKTCRMFYDPAMDQIWETLTAIEPAVLERLSSATSVTNSTGSYPALLHPLSDDDRDTIQRLSSRVRRLHINLRIILPRFDETDVSPQWVYQLASLKDSSLLFPNRHVLSLEVESYPNQNPSRDVDTRIFQAIIRLFYLLVGPHLSALRFEVPNSIYPHLNISSIPLLCPNIRTLSLGELDLYCEKPPISDEIMCGFSEAVSQLRHLETVRSYLTSWDLLSSLAEAKGLRKLWMFLPPKLGPVPTPPHDNTFPQLRTLDICTRSLTLCLEFLRWASLKEVTGIYIYCPCPTDDGDPLKTLVDVSSRISLQCKQLEFLWIFFNPGADHHETPTAWPLRMLKPYHDFHQLRVIALQTGYSMELVDHDLEGMVAAWPHLEIFHLFPDGIMDPPVRLTLRAVTALLYHCPKLKRFTLLFDATRVRRRSLPSFRGDLVQNTSVEYMGVYTSPVSRCVNVGRYLSKLMPCLELVGVFGTFLPRWSRVCARHQRKPKPWFYECAKTYPVFDYDNDGDAGHGTEWLWTCRRNVM